MAKACALSTTLFLYAAVVAGPLRPQAPADACPADEEPAQIEVLLFEQNGNTCGFQNHVRTYGGTCRIQRVDYSGPDPIYKVRLNPGHRGVAFHLDVDPSADLVLALLRECSDGASCVNSSPDFIGGRAEEISAASYPPGVYYLMVDSAADRQARCGAYRLTVKGTNPTPDLILAVTAPEPAIAGETLTYTLSVTNSGALEATGVALLQTLPPGVALVSASPGCQSAEPGKVRCTIDRLAIGAPVSRQVTFKLNPATRGTLASLATVRGIEGDPSPANNEKTLTTLVKAQSDLSIANDASRTSVVAGRHDLTYTLKVQNHGPSDATQVVVMDDLPEEVDFVSVVPTQTCSRTNRQVRCKIGKLAPDARETVTIKVRVKSSAIQFLRNQARVAALEPGLVEINTGNNAATRRTPVTRLTDLSVTKTGPVSVVAGDELTYQITVVNYGPSDSMGAMVNDTLPPGVSVVLQSGCDPPTHPLPCSTGPIPKGSQKDLSLTIHVPPSLRTSPISNHVSVVPADAREKDQETTTNNQDTEETPVEIQADLELMKTATPLAGTSTVLAGENLLYTLKVTNRGPSDSSGGTISDPLDSHLKFVGSRDGCRRQVDGSVECSVPPLAVDGEGFEARFVAKVALDAPGSINNQATVTGKDPDLHPGNNSNDLLTTTVLHEADLAVSLHDSPDPVREGNKLTYTLTVTNAGPSDAEDVSVHLATVASPALDSTPPDCMASLTGMGLVADCSLVPAGTSKIFKVLVTAPAAAETPLIANAEISSTTEDPVATNNTSSARTTLVAERVTAADLEVTKSTDAEAVVAGDLLRYTLEVVNHGPDVAMGVKVEDILKGGLTLAVPIDPVTCNGLDTGTWSVGALGLGASQRCTFLVRVDPTFAGDMVSNTASVASAVVMDDPYSDNNTSTVETPVLRVPPLILPFFQTDSDPGGASTRFAVRNPSPDHAVCAVFDYFRPSSAQSENTCIAPKGVATTEVLYSSSGDHGYVGITPDCSRCEQCTDCRSPEPTEALAGDFFRSDSDLGPVGGEVLLSTITAGRPSELCRRWVTRFVGARSEVVFFIPELPAGGATARGRVYNEAGDFVQTVEVSASEKAFRRKIGELQDVILSIPPGVLASAGAIEWELPEGIVGNLSSTLRAAGNVVALPGICRRFPASFDLGAEPSLLLPYFTIEGADSTTEPTSLFAVRNLTDREVKVRYEYLGSDGMKENYETQTLKGHAMRSVDLRKVTALAEGSLRITLPDDTGSGRREQILGGDYIRRDDPSSLKDRSAGSALVNTGRLCRRWDVRFIQRNRTTTAFVFYRDAPETPVKGKAHDNDGRQVKEFQAPISTSASFEVSAEDLGLTGEGSIEWDLGGAGHVAAVFRNENFGSVLVPGVCRDLEVP